MDYVIYNDEGYLDYEGCFGDMSEAITFTLYQASAVCNATDWDYEEYEETRK